MINVKGYTTKKGTYVKPHTRSEPQTPIEAYWNSSLSKNDMSVPYQKMFKKQLDNNPRIVKLLMEI